MATMQEMIRQQEMQKKYQAEQARRAELQARQKRQQTLSTPAKLYGNANMYDKMSNWLAGSPNQTISNIGTKMSQYSPVKMGKQAIGDMVNKVTGGLQSKLPMFGSGNIGAIGSAVDSSIGGLGSGLGSIGGGTGIFAPEAGTIAGTLGAGEGAGALSGAIGANVAGSTVPTALEGAITSATSGAGAGLAGGAGAALGAVAAPLAIAALVGSMIHQKNVEKASKEAQIGQQINQEADAQSTNDAMTNIANTPTQTQQKLLDTANQTLAQTQQPQLPTDIAGMQQYMRDNNYSDEAINGLTQGLNYEDSTIDNWIKGYNEQNPNAMINIPKTPEEVALAREGKFNVPKEEGIADKVSGIMGQLKQGFNEGTTDTGLNKLGMVGGKVYDVLSHPATQGIIAGLAYAKDGNDALYGLKKGIEYGQAKAQSDYYDRMMGRRPGILPGMGKDDYKTQQDVINNVLKYELDLANKNYEWMDKDRKYGLNTKEYEEKVRHNKQSEKAQFGRNDAIIAGNIARGKTQKYWQEKEAKKEAAYTDAETLKQMIDAGDDPKRIDEFIAGCKQDYGVALFNEAVNNVSRGAKNLKRDPFSGR